MGKRKDVVSVVLLQKEAEQAVLASLIIDPFRVNEVVLESEDFQSEPHSIIFKSMRDLKGNFDLTLLCDDLTRRGQLEEVGGRAYLSQLLVDWSTSYYLPHYERIVLEYSFRVKAARAAAEVAQIAHNIAIPQEELPGQIEAVVTKMLSTYHGRHDIRHGSYWADRSLTRILKAHKEGADAIIPAPVPMELQNSIGRMIGWFRSSTYYIVAARPGKGKTALALSMCYYLSVLTKKAKIGFFTAEMPPDQLTDRLISMITGISLDDIELARFKDNQWQEIYQAERLIQHSSLYFANAIGQTIESLCNSIRRAVMMEGLDLIIIDYIQNIKVGDDRLNENDRLTLISNSLRNLKNELGLPFLVLAQVTRAPEGRTGKLILLSDLRGSGAMEQDADVVLFLQNSDAYEEFTEISVQLSRNPLQLDTEVVVLDPAKNRKGSTKLALGVLFNKRRMLFADIVVKSAHQLTI